MYECYGFGREIVLLFEHASGCFNASGGLVDLVSIFEQAIYPCGDKVGVTGTVSFQAFACVADFLFEVIFHFRSAFSAFSAFSKYDSNP